MFTSPLFKEDKICERIKNGVEKLTKVVASTLGPTGLNVIIDRGIGAPIVTKDGVTVARHINLPDRVEALGAEIVKQAAMRSNDLVGDGTTTATVLANAFIQTLQIQEISPQLIRRKLEQAVDETICLITRDIKIDLSDDVIKRVATISANDVSIGSFIADAYAKIGKKGIILVETAKDFKTKVEIIDGIQFESLIASQYFFTDQYRQIAELENPVLLITNKTIRSFTEILAPLDWCVKNSKPFVIIANDFENDALSNLIANNAKGVLKVLAIKAPGIGDRQEQYLNDIATYTGATFLSNDLGNLLKTFDPKIFGYCGKIVATSSTFSIIEGKNDAYSKTAYYDSLAAILEITTDEWEKKQLEARLARLAGGVAVIKVGGDTEAELIERKYRVIDAVSATKAAISDGIVPGGGIALLRASEHFSSTFPQFAKAIKEPFRTILRNAGESDEKIDEFEKKIFSSANKNFGFDLSCEEFCDLVESGIVDPFKVTKIALLNACSAASMILTSATAIVEVK